MFIATRDQMIEDPNLLVVKPLGDGGALVMERRTPEGIARRAKSAGASDHAKFVTQQLDRLLVTVLERLRGGGVAVLDPECDLTSTPPDSPATPE